MAPRPARAAAFGLFPILLLALIAGGCGERSGAGAPVTLVFKHAKILGPADPVPGLLRRFEAEHPGVRVKSEALTWSSDEQHQFYVINLEGGSPPFDVMMLDVIWVPEFARAGWILDLTPSVAPGRARRPLPERDRARAAGRSALGAALVHERGPALLPRRSARQVRLPRPRDLRRADRPGAADPGGRAGSELDGYLWQGKQYEGGMVNVLEALWANGARLLDAARAASFPSPRARANRSPSCAASSRAG